ncbi:amino acid adenylation domain-containing protein [Polymorphospora sp. NPDC050346]|uniref:amino acid adenylation domain-containing protein n=1 Tax=Polymorphospora sp. NPDC050346 TaxID=3155780 RepID=UPI0033DC538D
MTTSIDQKRRALLELRLKQRRALEAEQERITPVPRDGGPLPVSHLQEGLWFLHQLDPSSPVYHVIFALRLRGDLDVGALRRALAALAGRHEGLRTRFGSRDGVPYQVVDPAPDDWPVPVTDLDEARLGDWVNDLVQQPSDLERGPMLRTWLARLADDEHVLLLVVHHIVADGWSVGLLTAELAELYDAARAGRAAALPPLAIQPADHAAWQRRWLTGERLDRQLDFWRDNLRDLPALDFPTDRPHPAQPKGAGALMRRELPDRVAAASRELALGEQASLLAVLLAGFLVVLERYTGQDDLAVGSVFSGRTRSQTEPLVGYFANALVLRTDVAGDPTFRELVGRCNATVLGATAHQEVPFGLVVDALNPDRSPGRNPLFQVSFTLQAAGVSGDFRLGDVAVSPVDIDWNRARFDIAFAVVEKPGGGIDALVEYSTELFDADRIDRLVEHFEVVLRRALAEPDTRIGDLPVTGHDERRRMVEEWNPAPVERSAALLHDLVTERATAQPDHTAMRFEGTELTYRDLDRRANQLAHQLVHTGARPGTVTALLLDRGLHLPVAELAILKAGSAWLALDPQYPDDRLAYQLHDAHVTTVVTTTDLTHRLPHHIHTITLDTDHTANQPTTPPTVDIHPEDTAYVIYTSGSTGRPKGVMVPHRAIVNFCRNMRELFKLGPDDRVLQLANPTFDVSVSDFFATLSAGATVVGAPRSTLLDPDRLQELMRDARITFGDIPPAVLRLLDPGPLVDLRVLFIGMEAYGPELVNRWQRPGLEFHNGYGPTEVTITCTDYRCPDEPLTGQPPIGRAMGNQRAYVLDRRLRPVPVGVPGELYMAGDGLAHGYLGRTDLTAEKFLPDPFTTQPGQRMYATGDVVRWRTDGNIEFVGRVDRQVKIRGLRIELSEIEHAVNGHPAIRQCTVVVREPGTPQAYLAAYVVPEAGQEPRDEELRGYLADRLPLHMVPATVVTLAELPLTASGKVDEARLPVPEPVRGGRDAPPETDTERRLADIWQGLLDVDAGSVGVHDSFFNLGGNSLQATQLISRIRDGFGVTVDPRQLFVHPTLEQLGKLVDGGEATAGDRIAPVDRAGPLPVSHQQEGLWFLHQLDPASPVYHIPIALRLRGDLDVTALRGALAGLVGRHEALRTRFVARDGVPHQVIDPAPADWPLPVTGTDPAGLAGWVADQARLPFDLGTGSGLRTCLARLADDDHVLLVVLHHIIADGWSVGVVTAELPALYDAARTGGGATLAPLAVQPADHAAWQRRTLDGDLLDQQLGYWRQRLADLPELEFPTDRARPAQPTGAGALADRRVPADLADRLRDLARTEQTSFLAVLLAGFLVVLNRHTGQGDLVVGSVFSGRTRSEIEPLVGYFANTLVLRTDVAGDPTFRELVHRCRDTVLGATAHQDVPFGTLVDTLRPERVPGRNPLFQVSFTLQTSGVAGGELRLGGTVVEPVGFDWDRARFDLAISAVDPGAGPVDLNVEYSTELFDGDRIGRLLDHLAAVYAQAVDAPDGPVGGLDPLSAAEHAALEGWGAKRADFPADESLYQLFAEQVRRTPDNVAVVAGDIRLTYREVDRQAGRVAAKLAELGTGPGDLVAVCLPRTADLVTGILGILRAGAAYVPVDPDQPADRMAHILADSGVRTVLTLPGTQLPAGDHQRVSVEDLPDGQAPVTPVTGADLAYLIYTSGSTGRPKAVMIPHRNVVRLLRGTRHWYHFGPDDVWTLFHSAAFDVSVWELWGSLLHGGRLVVVPYWETRSPERFHELLRRERVTVLGQTPAAFRQLVAADEEWGGPSDELALRTVIFAGEALDVDSVLRWFDRHGEERPRLVNMYGITETTVHTTYQVLSRELLARSASPIGVAIPDLPLRVVDAAGRPAPIGVWGELLVGGPGVAYGYLGRPELTAQRFVPAGNGRFYRSGDLARWRSDGTLEYLGRADQQVKIRGFRVELGEIETVLAGHPDVTDAVVVVRGDARNPRLVAYVVGTGYDEAALRSYLAARLPAYMVPAILVRLDAIPLTGNGKTNRKALPEPRHEIGGEHVAPRNPAERDLAGIWAGVLGTDRIAADRIGVRDNFFDLGGNSLDLVRLAAEVRRVFDVALDPRSLYAAPTLEAMAGTLGPAGAGAIRPAGAGSTRPASPLVPIVTTGDRPPLFFVHPVGGSVAPYVRLAGLLGPDQPFYGLEDPALHGGTPGTSIAATAAAYVAAVQRQQPAGPYHLGGWSLGGAVALEMAHQLRERGQRVALVAALDTGLPDGSDEPDHADLLAWFVRDLAGIARARPPAVDPGQLRGRPEAEQVAAVLAAVADLVPGGLADELATRVRVFTANYRALLRHRPRPYPGRVLLLSAADEPADDLDRWRAVAAGGLDRRTVPGDHYTMLQPPNLPELARALRAGLDQADPGGAE